MATFSEAISGALSRPTAPMGVWGWVTTVDHKRIGVLYLVTAMIFVIGGGIEALLIRLQLATPESNLVAAGTYNQLFTMHALTMIFLGVMPLSAAFFNLIIPLQIGARDVAFPRLNALSYWIFLFGGLLLNAGFLKGEAADAGWFSYANLSSITYSPGQGVDFFTLGLLVLGISSIAAALNFVITIVNMRAPGMSLMRMPVFTWMTLVTSLLLVTAMPVLTVGLVALMFDRTFGAAFFNPALGGDPVLWQHLFWVFGHPEVYILILPAMGIVSEVLPTFSRKPLFGYPLVVLSGVIIGFMSWGVWSHHMFTVGLGSTANSVFALTTMVIAIPTGIKIFNWIGTLWGGSISFTSPMLFALGFISMFIIGGISGIMHTVVPSDYQQQDTYFVVAHLHYVLVGGSIFGIMAGIYYWFPKMTGRMLHDGMGKLNFWLMFIGFNATFFPMHFLGMDGMPRRIFTYPEGMGWDFWNMFSTVGAFIIALSGVVFVYNAIRSLRAGELAGADPWDGRTLEWSIPSPPPEYNFAEIPTVRGLDAFWEQKYRHDVTVPVGGGSGEDERSQDGHGEEAHAAESGYGHQEGEHHGIHMPSPSYFPVVAALGLGLVGAGFASHWTVSIFGAVLLLLGAYGWVFEPATAGEE